MAMNPCRPFLEAALRRSRPVALTNSNIHHGLMRIPHWRLQHPLISAAYGGWTSCCWGSTYSSLLLSSVGYSQLLIQSTTATGVASYFSSKPSFRRKPRQEKKNIGAATGSTSSPFDHSRKKKKEKESSRSRRERRTRGRERKRKKQEQQPQPQQQELSYASRSGISSTNDENDENPDSRHADHVDYPHCNLLATQWTQPSVPAAQHPAVVELLLKTTATRSNTTNDGIVTSKRNEEEDNDDKNPHAEQVEAVIVKSVPHVGARGLWRKQQPAGTASTAAAAADDDKNKGRPRKSSKRWKEARRAMREAAWYEKNSGDTRNDIHTIDQEGTSVSSDERNNKDDDGDDSAGKPPRLWWQPTTRKALDADSMRLTSTLIDNKAATSEVLSSDDDNSTKPNDDSTNLTLVQTDSTAVMGDDPSTKESAPASTAAENLSDASATAGTITTLSDEKNKSDAWWKANPKPINDDTASEAATMSSKVDGTTKATISSTKSNALDHLFTALEAPSSSNEKNEIDGNNQVVSGLNSEEGSHGTTKPPTSQPAANDILFRPVKATSDTGKQNDAKIVAGDDEPSKDLNSSESGNRQAAETTTTTTTTTDSSTAWWKQVQNPF